VGRKPIVGTIVGIFSGALDGTRAQLIRRIKLGYTVELLESKGTFKKGDILLLSAGQFKIDKKATTTEEA
jgi:hypothetical protein